MIVDHFWKNKASINCIIPCILSYISFKTLLCYIFQNQNADLPPIEAVHATLVRHLVRSPRICNCPGRSAGRYTFSDKLHLQEKWLRKMRHIWSHWLHIQEKGV